MPTTAALFNASARGVGKAHSLFAGVPAQLDGSKITRVITVNTTAHEKHDSLT
ncbi:hypothetical protein [Desulfuromonas acetoxidans]|uniref:hypothetical protein n=1 Tax=Desulfuromonas acetoxidans TaxID=891 RepID=UPI00292FEF66|nr:hypothetical protein [Desulfuromonas acetoxidans]